MGTYMAAEIESQPRVLREILRTEGDNVARIAAAVHGFSPCFTMMVARGSSDNAALYGKYIFGALNRVPVALAAPSLFTLYESPPDLSRALVIAISQSGQSPDLLEVAGEARRQGAVTVALTNDPTSPLAVLCEWVIPLHAGPERSVAATKSYTAQLMALAMLSASLAGRSELMEELSGVPEQVRVALESREQARLAAEKLRESTRCVVIGRGYDYSTAQEIALKLKELTSVAAEPYSSADFLHGPVAMVDEGFPAVLIAPSGVAFQELSDLAGRLTALGVEVIGLSDRQSLLSSVTAGIAVPRSTSEWLAPFLTVVPGQWLALELALARGLDPDRPRRLSKVTRTR